MRRDCYQRSTLIDTLLRPRDSSFAKAAPVLKSFHLRDLGAGRRALAGAACTSPEVRAPAAERIRDTTYARQAIIAYGDS